MRSGGIELPRALGYKLTYIGWHSSARSWQHRQPHIVGQRAVPAPREAAPEKVLFLLFSWCKNLAVRYGLKIIDNSTYIVGIYRPAVIGRLYTFHGVGLLSYLSLRHAKASQLDKTKIDFPHLSCTPKLNPFSPGIEEHKTY